MKIFVTKNYPDAYFYFKVLFFLREHATEAELRYYVDMVCEDYANEHAEKR